MSWHSLILLRHAIARSSGRGAARATWDNERQPSMRMTQGRPEGEQTGDGPGERAEGTSKVAAAAVAGAERSKRRPLARSLSDKRRLHAALCFQHCPWIVAMASS